MNHQICLSDLGVREFFIPLNVVSSKNSKVWTGAFIVNQPAAKTWIEETQDFFTMQGPFARLQSDLMANPLFVEMTFVRKGLGVFDYNNISQIVFDQMKAHGWITDDSDTYVLPCFLGRFFDKLRPGVYIRFLLEKPYHEGQEIFMPKILKHHPGYFINRPIKIITKPKKP